jgi:hypothetical protein
MGLWAIMPSGHEYNC